MTTTTHTTVLLRKSSANFTSPRVYGKTYKSAGQSCPGEDDHNNQQSGDNGSSEAHPLPLARSSCARDSTVELHISLFEILVCVHVNLLDILYHGLLFRDYFIQVFDELSDLIHVPLNSLEIGAALANVGKRALGLTATVQSH